LKRFLSKINNQGLTLTGVVFITWLAVAVLAGANNKDVFSIHVDQNVRYSWLLYQNLWPRQSKQLAAYKVERYVDKNCSFTADLEMTESDIYEWLYWFASADGALNRTQRQYTLAHSVISKNDWQPTPYQTNPMITVAVTNFYAAQAVTFLSSRAQCDYVLTAGAKRNFAKPIVLNYSKKSFTNIISNICSELHVEWVPTKNSCILYYLPQELSISSDGQTARYIISTNRAPTIMDLEMMQSAELEPLAAQGSAKAQGILADRYRTETHTSPLDYAKALKWSKLAAEQNDPIGGFVYAYLLHSGFGVTEKDRHKAQQLLEGNHENLRKMAKEGDSIAQFAIGWMYDHGYVVEKNKVKALLWYKKSAGNGYPQAAYNIGMFYTSGRQGIKRDLKKGYYWLDIAANAGVTEAQIMIKILDKRMKNSRHPLLTPLHKKADTQ
jgi:hypothetical protein